MNDEINVVEMLREKTEESNLNKYLKKTMGGYTKKSVIDYLNILRKQLQSSQETFSKNLEDLFIEKENLKKDNESLTIRYNKLYAEYEKLTESLKSINTDIDEKDASAEDFVILKSNIVRLEEESKKWDREKYALERKIEQQQTSIDELVKELELSKQETKTKCELLKAERVESNKQREIVADLSCLLEAEKDEVEFLKKKLTEENFAKLNHHISQLTEELKNSTEAIEKLNAESLLKDNTINTLKAEIEMLKENLNDLTKTNNDLNLQNSKLILVNENLTYKLEDEYKKSILLIKEKSGIAIEKLLCESKLRDSESVISSLEMKINKIEKINGIKEIKNTNGC